MRIEEIEVLAFRLDVIEDRHDSSQDAVVVRITSDEGVTGLGEADSSPAVVKAVIEASGSHRIAAGLREVLLGTDPLDVDARCAELFERTLYLGSSGIVMHAISAIEMALWDLRGKVEGKPVWQLLSPERTEPVGPRAYGTVLAPRDRAGLQELRANAERQGLVGVKIAWGGGDPVPGGDEAAYVREARAVLGDRLDLRVDLSCSWTEADLERPLDHYVECDVQWIEEPFHPTRLDLYRALCARSPVPVAAGENESTHAGFAALADAGVGVLQPDIARCGGLRAAQRVRRLADDHGITCVPHVWSTGVNIAAAVHWATAVGAPLVERSLGTSPLTAGLVTGAPRLVDGRYEVPTAPGLGIELDEDQVVRFTDKHLAGRA